MSRLVRRLLVGGGMAALLVGVAAAPALAHVTVNSTNAKQGGFGTIAIRVPTESDTASTTGVKVQFPADAPIANASIKPLPGWSYKVTTTKPATPIKNDDGEEVSEVVSVIEWTADSADAAIKPGEYQEFELSVGPLPKVDSLEFKTIQTYNDGSQVAWIEEKTAGAESPEHPAPVLKLLPAFLLNRSSDLRAGRPRARGGGSRPLLRRCCRRRRPTEPRRPRPVTPASATPLTPGPHRPRPSPTRPARVRSPPRR